MGTVKVKDGHPIQDLCWWYYTWRNTCQLFCQKTSTSNKWTRSSISQFALSPCWCWSQTVKVEEVWEISSVMLYTRTSIKIG